MADGATFESKISSLPEFRIVRGAPRQQGEEVNDCALVLELRGLRRVQRPTRIPEAEELCVGIASAGGRVPRPVGIPEQCGPYACLQIVVFGDRGQQEHLLEAYRIEGWRMVPEVAKRGQGVTGDRFGLLQH